MLRLKYVYLPPVELGVLSYLFGVQQKSAFLKRIRNALFFMRRIYKLGWKQVGFCKTDMVNQRMPVDLGVSASSSKMELL